MPISKSKRFPMSVIQAASINIRSRQILAWLGPKINHRTCQHLKRTSMDLQVAAPIHIKHVKDASNLLNQCNRMSRGWILQQLAQVLLRPLRQGTEQRQELGREVGRDCGIVSDIKLWCITREGRHGNDDPYRTWASRDRTCSCTTLWRAAYLWVHIGHTCQSPLSYHSYIKRPARV
jgi:hypothetical protein